MTNERDNYKEEQAKSQETVQNNQGSEKKAASNQPEGERMTDGTNDFKNGDQEPASEQASEGGQSNR